MPLGHLVKIHQHGRDHFSFFFANFWVFLLKALSLEYIQVCVFSHFILIVLMFYHWLILCLWYLSFVSNAVSVIKLQNNNEVPPS